MRDQTEHGKKGNGPLGIRVGIWLVAFGSMIVCVLMIALCRHDTNLFPPDPAEGQPDGESSARLARRNRQREFVPASSEMGANYDIEKGQLAVLEQMAQDRRTWMDNPATSDK